MAHVAGGPGSAPADPSTPRQPPPVTELEGVVVQPLASRVEYDRIEAPRHYPDNDLVAATRAAIWVEDVPPYGIRALPLGAPTEPGTIESPNNPVRVDAGALDNGLVRVTVDDRGRLTLATEEGTRRIVDLVGFENHVDRGDLYTPSIRQSAEAMILRSTRVTHRGPLIGELRLHWRAERATGRSSVASVRVALLADSPLVRLEVIGTNRTRDHRLRFVVATDVRDADVWADAAFGPIRRVSLPVPDEDRAMETPPTTDPLHRYVSLFGVNRGATLYSDGLAEYETSRRGSIYITLVRAVGELSRNDLPERPGHAGWPAPTPRAQSLGRYSARFALLLHGPRSPAVVDAIERAADDALLPLEGRTLRAALEVPSPISGVELVGEGLTFSALKESENGEWIVARCVNVLDEAVEGVWRFGMPVREARYARLDETPLEALNVTDGGIVFTANPRAIVTVLVR
jgi:hypothetical protein